MTQISLSGSRTQLSRVIGTTLLRMTGACTNRYTNKELEVLTFNMNVIINMHDNIATRRAKNAISKNDTCMVS